MSHPSPLNHGSLLQRLGLQACQQWHVPGTEAALLKEHLLPCCPGLAELASNAAPAQCWAWGALQAALGPLHRELALAARSCPCRAHWGCCRRLVLAQQQQQLRPVTPDLSECCWEARTHKSRQESLESSCSCRLPAAAPQTWAAHALRGPGRCQGSCWASWAC